MGDIGSRQVRYEVMPTATVSVEPRPVQAPAPDVSAELAELERLIVRSEPVRP